MKSFKLEQDPTSQQLAIHINNLIAYFHPLNKSIRLPAHKEIYLSSSQIISGLLAMGSEGNRKTFATVTFKQPIAFRMLQIVNHYGEKQVASYIHMVHGKAA